MAWVRGRGTRPDDHRELRRQFERAHRAGDPRRIGAGVGTASVALLVALGTTAGATPAGTLTVRGPRGQVTVSIGAASASILVDRHAV